MEKLVDLIASDTKFYTAMVTAICTVSLFFIGRILETAGRFHERMANRKRLIVALYTEISHNKEDLENSIAESFAVDAIIEKLTEKEERVPHATYYRNMRFFDELKQELHILPPQILEATVRFYNTLEAIYAVIDGFERDSFKNMSIEGKKSTLDELVSENKKAIREAIDALELYKNRFKRVLKGIS